MDFYEAVRKRRIVRNFEGRPVDREVLERITLAAQRAPSAGFSQGQRLLVVTEPERRRAIAEAVGEEGLVGLGFDPSISPCAAMFIHCVSEEVYHRRYREPDKLAPDGEGSADGPFRIGGRMSAAQ